MKLIMVLVLLLVATVSSGCMTMMGYQASNIQEWIAQSEQLNANGCVYVRGNSRPYADVSMLYIAAYGKNAPKYLDCLQAIPPDARALP